MDYKEPEWLLKRCRQQMKSYQESAGATIEMKPPPIKNKSCSVTQITADSILKDAEIHRPAPSPKK